MTGSCPAKINYGVDYFPAAAHHRVLYSSFTSHLYAIVYRRHVTAHLNSVNVSLTANKRTHLEELHGLNRFTRHTEAITWEQAFLIRKMHHCYSCRYSKWTRTDRPIRSEQFSTNCGITLNYCYESEHALSFSKCPLFSSTPQSKRREGGVCAAAQRRTGVVWKNDPTAGRAESTHRTGKRKYPLLPAFAEAPEVQSSWKSSSDFYVPLVHSYTRGQCHVSHKNAQNEVFEFH